jgi:hypothetical protein
VPPDWIGAAVAAGAGSGRTRFQTVSRITASAAIATMATNVCGAFRSVSAAKKTSTTLVAAIPTSTTSPSAQVSDRLRFVGLLVLLRPAPLLPARDAAVDRRRRSGYDGRPCGDSDQTGTSATQWHLANLLLLGVGERGVARGLNDLVW